MIEALLNALKKAFEGIRPWIVVAPWEQGLRVRLGKYVTLLAPGYHLKIPLVDISFVQGVRLRICDLGKQTVTRAGGKAMEAVTFNGNVEYQLSDIEQMFATLQHPTDAVRNAARACLAAAIRTGGEELPSIEESALQAIKSEMSGRGVAVERIRLAEFAIVRTYRLIGDYGTYTAGKDLSVDDK